MFNIKNVNIDREIDCEFIDTDVNLTCLHPDRKWMGVFQTTCKLLCKVPDIYCDIRAPKTSENMLKTCRDHILEVTK